MIEGENPRPGPSNAPRPRPGARACSRYRRDGSRCGNTTLYVDGWCREPDCDGFNRARAEAAPEIVLRPPGSATVDDPPGPALTLELDEVGDVRVTTRALDSFRFHHGGGAAEAATQLRTMLEDFLLDSTRRDRNGFVHLVNSGFQLVLSEGGAAITGYSTLHRERTWAQLRAGVRSRFTGQQRAPSGAQPERQVSLAASDVAAAVNPQTVMLTSRARTSFARRAGLRAATEDELDRLLRAELTGLAAGQVNAGYDGKGVVEVWVGPWRWLVRDDALVVVGVSLRDPG